MADDNTEVESDSERLLNEIEHPKPNIAFPSCRHVLAFMSFLGFINVYAMRVNLSVAVVAMVNSSYIAKKNVSSECVSNEPNMTDLNAKDGEFDWDTDTQGLILGAFFYGYITTQIPGGYLAHQFGGKLLFGLGVLCTAVFTLLTPVAAKLGVPVLVATRVLEGIGEGVTFPAMHAILSHWAPPLERSKLGTFVYAGSQFGTVVSLPISGWFCNSLGWESVFYFFGAIGCLWFIFWMLLAFDEPAKHPRISHAERIYIESSIGHNDTTRPSTPWVAILTSVPFWALLTCHVCNNWGFYTLLTCLPKYMSDVLGFDIASDGLLSALPYLVMWIMINVCGQTADYLRYHKILSTTAVRKLMNCIGLGGAAVFLIIVGYVGCNRTAAVVVLTLAVGISAAGQAGYNVNHLDIAPVFAGLGGAAVFLVAVGYVGCDRVLAVGMLTLAVGISSAGMSGYQVNHIDIGPLFAGTLLGITNAAATIPGFVGPQVVGVLTKGVNSSLAEQWREVFFISAAIYIAGFLVFLCFGSGEEQPWAKGDNKNRPDFTDSIVDPRGLLNSDARDTSPLLSDPRT